MGEPGGLPSMGSHRVRHDRSDLAAAAAVMHQYWFLNCTKTVLMIKINHDGMVTPNILECKVKWNLGSFTMNKASGNDGIPAKQFKILKDNVVEVLHSICQQIWKTQQCPQEWKRSVFILIPKNSNAKECSNYCTIALIPHAGKVMLKIL